MDGTGKIAMMKELLLFSVVCFVFKRRSQNSSYLAASSLCLGVFTAIQNISTLYSTEEILSYSCKIIFRNVCKAIRCDKLHNLLLDLDSFRCFFSLDNQIMFCFKAVQLLPDAAPCRTSFLIARLGPDVDCIIPKNPSAPASITSSPVSCQCRVPGISESVLSLLT